MIYRSDNLRLRYYHVFHLKKTKIHLKAYIAAHSTLCLWKTHDEENKNNHTDECTKKRLTHEHNSKTKQKTKMESHDYTHTHKRGKQTKYSVYAVSTEIMALAATSILANINIRYMDTAFTYSFGAPSSSRRK